MKRASERQEDYGDGRRFQRMHREELDSPTVKQSHTRPGQSTSQAPRTFAVRPTSNFSGVFPNFIKPRELGHFSLEIDRSFLNNDKHLKQYHPPNRESNLSLDLRQGFDTYVKRDDDVKERLNNVMKWIISNKTHFQKPERNIRVRYDSNKQDDLIESLGVDFISWRGHLRKFLCTPYENREGWEMAVTLFRGTVYISEVETEEDRQRRLGMNEFEQLCTYGGYKFEQYLTCEDGKKSPDLSKPVNNIEAYCSVVRSDLGPFKLLYSGEVDCIMPGSKLKQPENYVELKTSRKWYTQKNESSFYRYKLVKWWAQSFLVGIPQVICGFRDDNGIVREIKHFKTMEMPKLSSGFWDGSVCFNFLLGLLAFIKSVAVIDDPSMVYLFERKPGASLITYTEHRGDKHKFIPEWYINAFGNEDGASTTEAKAASDVHA